MNKIFEVREYTDGGPQDRGYPIKYVEEVSLEEATTKHKESNWIEVREITQEHYNSLKKEAIENMKMFTI